MTLVTNWSTFGHKSCRVTNWSIMWSQIVPQSQIEASHKSCRHTPLAVTRLKWNNKLGLLQITVYTLAYLFVVCLGLHLLCPWICIYMSWCCNNTRLATHRKPKLHIKLCVTFFWLEFSIANKVEHCCKLLNSLSNFKVTLLIQHPADAHPLHSMSAGLSDAATGQF